MSATFRSFAIRNYRIWFAGALVSNVGTWMQRIAQDWLVLAELTDDDATAVGVVMALQFGPQLLLLPLTGWIADRFDRRRVLIITQVTMLLLGFGLGLVTLLGVVQLWMVFGFALGLGVAAAFDAPVRQAFVGELVSDKLLANAVALNSASFNGARLIGPAVAGVLVGVIGSGWVFMLNAATYLAVIGSLFLLRPSEFTTFTKKAKGRGQMRVSQGFFSMATTCSQCRGTGTVIKNPCRTCNGEGAVRSKKKLSVKIPAGVDTGSRLKIHGEGDAGVLKATAAERRMIGDVLAYCAAHRI